MFSAALAEADQSLNNCNCLGKKSVNSSELPMSKAPNEHSFSLHRCVSHIPSVNIDVGTCVLSSQNVQKICFSNNIFSPFLVHV